MLQFVRETPIRIHFQETLSMRRGFLSSESRLFFFHVSAGFSKAVDPLSGMTVNLVLVDQWLADLKKNFESDSQGALLEMVFQARSFLQEKAKKEGAILTHLDFREERGWSLSWAPDLGDKELRMSSVYFLESLPKNEKGDLIKLQLRWRGSWSPQADLFAEGFRLIKNLPREEASSLQKEVASLIGTRVSAGPFLESALIQYLGEGYSLELP